VQICQSALKGKVRRLVVLYGDCPLLRPATLEALLAAASNSEAAGVVVTTILDQPEGYGRVLRDDSGFVAAIVEEKDATAEQKMIREINSGIYCLDADLLWRYIADLRPNPVSGEIYLTDIAALFRSHGLRLAPLRLDDPEEVLGINTRVELAAADRILRGRKTRQLMLDGVTVEKPETVTIDAFVEIGPDTVIEPFVQLRGRTKIGPESRIGTGALVYDSDIAGNVRIEPYSIIRTSIVGAGAVIGPFARLRMENCVEAGAQVGNFVELKKTRLGAKSKAMHLAYLGDSDIGEGVNIGAGTITCNYDGRQKHRTIIGDHAFVGSDSILVAPLEIGEGAYIAAGSVITDPVPADTLALGRARQVNKPGWPSARAKKAE
jgi:bifunctional UDP-N-acetylglucosamine pyrophosphorylase/glucosamine-1-phosphate N-acetyltransferase